MNQFGNNIFETERYNVEYRERKTGGPAGYESVYLTDIGDETKDSFYKFLDSMEGTFLPAQKRKLRGRNIDSIKKYIEERVGVVSGFKPSGPFHFGHRIVSDSIKYFQGNGIQTFIPIADSEAFLACSLDKKDYEYFAADNLLDLGAAGIDLDKAHVYLQSEESRIKILAEIAAREIRLEDPIDIYGMSKMIDDFPFFFGGLMQVGDILLPQHPDFGCKTSFMLSGPDQDGHMKMTARLTERMKERGIAFTTPSAVYLPHMRGLDGNKFSCSNPEATLFLGAGVNRLSLEERIIDSIRKIEEAEKCNSEKSQECASDMCSYISEFNEALKRNGGEIRALKENIPFVLRKHYEARLAVFSYSLQRAFHETDEHELTEKIKRGAERYNVDIYKIEKPSFMEAPEKAAISEGQRQKTPYFCIIAGAADKIII
ncbi:MAG: hypothetical protein ISS95_01065 [Candidatus Aenigmarchaeota archaeon]|nr:hypothetical protein [Candidatus Aenigmarchaeota archaeon]